MKKNSGCEERNSGRREPREKEPSWGFKNDSTWHFDGNPLEFQWLVRWAVLMRELYRTRHSDPLAVLVDTEKAEKAMEEMGITERAITVEMIQNGFELAMAFAGVDTQNNDSEQVIEDKAPFEGQGGTGQEHEHKLYTQESVRMVADSRAQVENSVVAEVIQNGEDLAGEGSGSENR